MRVLVCGSTGCIGAAVRRALHSRGHEVIEAGRGLADSERSMRVDFMQAATADEWASRLVARRVEAVVNCAGILIESRSQRFDRIHFFGPIELFEGAALAGLGHVVQVSALGVGAGIDTLTPYMRSKRAADDRLATLDVRSTVLRPSLVYGPRSQSARLFATLASLPLIGLPGRGDQRLQPIHVYEIAEIVARLIERRPAASEVHELGGADVVDFRAMLAHYRQALGLGDALWLPAPLPLMMLGARLAESLPQKVFSRDTLRMLEQGSVPADNATARLLGRAPTALAQGLTIGTPRPALDLRVVLPAPVALALRASLAFMWIYTAAISIALPHESGVLQLLARCGFAGAAGTIALIASCSLNVGLGLFTLLRPSPLVFLLQAGAVVGYTASAALGMPELTIDHCGPLVKNLPVLMAVLVLWLADASAVRPARLVVAPRAPGGAPTLSGRSLLRAHVHRPR